MVTTMTTTMTMIMITTMTEGWWRERERREMGEKGREIEIVR